MKWTQRLMNAFKRGDVDRPTPGRLTMPRREDSVRDYPSAGLTPSKLATILREADDGSLSSVMQLYEEMEEKDAHLYSVANTRRLALTGLPWRVVSAADVIDGTERSRADEAAAYCREVLSELESLDEAMQHLSLAVGRNIAVVEVIWDVVEGVFRPVSLVPIDFTRIVLTDLDQPRILTEAEPRDGIVPPPHKFIIHTPHCVSGHPQRGGLLRVTAMAYLAKNLALKDWMIFAEVFGMPVRIARYAPSATPDEKRELLHMLESLGSNASGIFSQAVELQIIEASRGTAGPPYRHLIEFLNREMSKAWLGQTLTTDITGQRGSAAASQTHERVRQDILADDIRKEGQTIRRDLLTGLTRLKFGGGAPVPFFRRKLRPPADPKQLSEVLDAAVNQLGLEVPEDWARESLGIPSAGANSTLVRGRAD